jgi:hypothetical protein
MRTSSDRNTFAAIEPAEMKAIEGGAATTGLFPAAGSNIEKLVEPIQQRCPTPIIPILGTYGPTSTAAVS